MRLKLYIGIALLLGSLVVNGQSFKWQAPLQQVAKSGFYNIALTPDLIAKTESEELADIRIFEKNREIAWLLRKGTDSTDTAGTLNLEHYSNIPGGTVKVQELKGSKQSLITLTFNKAYQVNKLRLTVEGFRFYRREAWLAEPNPNFKPGRNREPYNRMLSFVILSGKPAIIELTGQNRYRKLYLIIENEDNPPLTVKKIDAFQQNMHLTAYLEKNKQYTIKAGGLNMSFPRYDLDYFNDSIAKSLPYIKVGNFSPAQTLTKQQSSFFISKSWIWGALTVLIAFIGYLSYRMINEMQRKKR